MRNDDEFLARKEERAARRAQRSGQAPSRNMSRRADTAQPAAPSRQPRRAPVADPSVGRGGPRSSYSGGAGQGGAAAFAGTLLRGLGRVIAAILHGLVGLLRVVARGLAAFARWLLPACARHPKRALAFVGTTAVVIAVLCVRANVIAERQAAFDAAATADAQAQAQAIFGAVDDTTRNLVEPTSTPRDQWTRGQMPYLYQIDPQWSHETYSGGRMRLQGCGPTALCMVYIELTGATDMDPVSMAQFATEHGYATEQNGSSWSLMTDGAAALGLTGKQLTPSESVLRAELEAGRPVICIMNPGHFTSSGHFIAIEKLDADGKAVVHDSNSWARSQKTWDLSTVCSEAASAWSFRTA